MIYLRTGANGTGKTLLTLRDVRAKQLKENRPVYWNGRFKLKPEKEAEFGWRRADVKDWETFEDGAIILVDECHNDMGVTSAMSVPDWVTKLSEHRARGFDFFLLTQHPSMLNKHVRGLVATPGWHQHLKRAPVGDLVSLCEYTECCMQPERPGASANATMVAFPKEVYEWYDSATLHTAKPRLPKKVFYGLAAVALLPVAVWFGYSSFMGNIEKKKQLLGVPSAAPAAPGAPGAVTGSISSSSSGKITTADYVNSFVPRVAGIPHTAPRYDEVTKVTDAPAIAACLSGASPRFKQATCRCYSQQGTLLDVPIDLCRQIVENGFFQDWQPAERQAKVAPQALSSPTPAQAKPGNPYQVVQADQVEPLASDQEQALRRPGGPRQAVGQSSPSAISRPASAPSLR